MNAIFVNFPNPIGDPQWVNVNEIAVVRVELFPGGDDGALITMHGGAHVSTIWTVGEVMSEMEAVAARAAEFDRTFG